MNNAVAFGSYVPGSSCVHQMNAQVKIVLACAFSIGAFFVDTWIGMAILWIATAVFYGASGVSLRKAAAGLWGVALILLLTVASNSLSIDITSLDRSGFTVSGFTRGCFFAARIALLVAACSLMTFTTSPPQLADGLRSLLSPLRALKLPVDDICMVISIALRFVPTITQEAYAVRYAQASRGAANQKGPVRAIKAWGAVLIPLFVRLFRRVDILAQAMDVRCYGYGKRGALREVAFGFADGAALVAGLAFIVLLGLLL